MRIELETYTIVCFIVCYIYFKYELLSCIQAVIQLYLEKHINHVQKKDRGKLLVARQIWSKGNSSWE